MRYILGLGSNLHPAASIPRILRALLQLAPRIDVGRVVETAPVAVDGASFLNLPVSFSSALHPAQLKQVCNAIEVAFGRDRDDPASKLKSRTADLDILFWLDESAVTVPAQLLPHEPYMRPMTLELLAALGLAADAETPALPPGVSLSLGRVAFGNEPVALCRDSRGYSLAPLLLHIQHPPGVRAKRAP